MKEIFYKLAIIIVVFSACKKDEDKDPEIDTVSVLSQPDSYVKAVGKVIEKGSFDIIDHGFVYSSSEMYGTSSAKVSLGKTLVNDSFSSSFKYTDLSYQEYFYVRAYLQNTKGTVFGRNIKFTPARISVNGVSPSVGRTGDTLVISGNNFSSGGDIVVKFNNVDAYIINTTSTQLFVRVPPGILSDSYWDSSISITVYINGVQNSQFTFSLLPTVTSFSPDHGTFGTRITITGTNLNNSSVFMDDVNVYINNNSGNSISFSVPNDIKSVKSKIKVVKNSKEIFAPGEFTMDSMKVSSITPSKGVEGSTFIIEGVNFNSNSSYNIVKIGGKTAYVSYGSNNTELIVTVPEGLNIGYHDIEIDNGLFLLEIPGSFHLVTPEITDFQPKSGAFGTLVTFTGENLFFPNSSISVIFGNSYANIKSSDSTEIKAYIPWVGGTDTKIGIKILKGYEDIIFTDSFTIIPPNISGFSPSTGSPGTIVTLTGEGFPTDNWSVNARFGTITAPVIGHSSTSVKVQVPSEAAEGPMKISLIFYSNTTITTSTDFIVIK